MRRLVIAEKGTAALRLAVVLSGGAFKRRHEGVTVFDFEREGVAHDVVGLRGHIVQIDYPEAYRDWEAADLADLVTASVEERVSEPTIADALRKLAVDADEVWVCTDYDREGELIGLEALRIARETKPNLPARRARFSALTGWEIEEAFRNPTDIDERLAASARAREEVDLAWGAVLTRFLSVACGLRGRDFLSVGRVQTPTLGLLVEREREVEEFVPQPYWTLTATIWGETSVRAEHARGRFWHRDEADAVHARAVLADEAVVVAKSSDLKEHGRPPPLRTTSFLAEASRLGLSAVKAMAIAEHLYRAGRISYPRTDNAVYPTSLNLRSAVERLLESDLADEASEVLAQETLSPSRGSTETTDHPPIYPTAGVRRTSLGERDWDVYALVARRFLATLAPRAKEELTETRFDIGGEAFVARGHRFLDPGWRKYVGPPTQDVAVPPFEVGDRRRVVAVTREEDETEPPPWFTQGRLIEEMDVQGLGTKSTRHEIVQKLYDRGYVEGHAMRVTAAGRAVVEALEVFGGEVARPTMTAGLERAMDAITRGEATAADVVRVSRQFLFAVLANMRSHEASIAHWVQTAIADESEVGPCERCGGTMLLRRTRSGRRFIGCSNYPACKNTRNVPPAGLIVPSLATCDRCGSRLLARVHRGVADLRCVTPTCSDEELTKIFGV